MAISFPVQFVATQGTSNALTRAYGSTVSAGDTLVAFCLVYHATETCDSVSDDINGAWTKAFGPVDCAAPARLYGFYKLNSAAGTPTVTGNFSNFNHKEIAVSRISGLSGGGAFDQYAANGATSTNPSSGLTGTLGASVCAAVGGHANSGVTATTGSGWTTDANMSNWIKTYFETQVTSTNSPIKADWTASNSHWAAGVMVFKDASSPDASASGGTGTGTGSGSGGTATGGSGGSATASGGTGTGTGSGSGGSATGGGSGTFTFDAAENNTHNGALNSVSVNWTWLGGTVGAITSITNGSGTITSAGMTISGLPAGAGVGIIKDLAGTALAVQEGTVT